MTHAGRGQGGTLVRLERVAPLAIPSEVKKLGSEARQPVLRSLQAHSFIFRDIEGSRRENKSWPLSLEQAHTQPLAASSSLVYTPSQTFETDWWDVDPRTQFDHLSFLPVPL